MSGDANQWSTVKSLVGNTMAAQTWMDEENRARVGAYLKYDEIYWNDPRQYALRVLDGESPIYIPNARTVVDTTSHYLLKGLTLSCENKETQGVLDNFLKREAFFSRFHTAKQAGVTRGDFVFHMTADPSKPDGSKISLNSVSAANVFPIWDDDEPGKLVGCSLAVQFMLPREDDPEQLVRLRKLTYRIEYVAGKKRISRHEAIYKIEGGFLSEKATLLKTILPKAFLDERITSIPVYWFKNRHWDGEDYGSSELRGLERLAEVVSQGATDVSAALSLEGLGVYATDGGRPVAEGQDGTWEDAEWEVAPGKVMEVPSGAYFRRVEGVGSITPAVDQIKYLESKINEAAGLTDVALGKVDAQVAQSGIALAIKFLPTLAKIETRDQNGIDILTQLFFDWKTWHGIFEKELLQGDIVPAIGDKLPTDRTARVNELNNMMDRKIISRKYYRSEMEALGFKFPSDLERQIEDEAKADLKRAREAMLATTPPATDEKSTDGDTLPSAGNGSNNKDAPNESKGTESKATRDA